MLNNHGRIRAFTGPNAEQRAERVGNWFKAAIGNEKARDWCVDHRVPLGKAEGEGVNQLGGYLVPQDFDDAIVVVRETYGAFRQGAENRPSKSDSQVRPRWSSGLTANWVAEGAAIPESSLELGAVGSTLKKLAILARGSSELFDDSAADLGEFLTSEIGYAFASQEDNCGFNGNGTSTYCGITGLSAGLTGNYGAIAAASGHHTFLTLDSTDIANLMAGVLASAIPGAAWYVSQIGYAQTLCRLAAVSGGLTATKRPDGTIDASFLGFPVRFSGQLPNSTGSLAGLPMMFFGNLKMSSLLVEKPQGTIIAFSRERSLETDQILVRGVQRIDIVNHDVGSAASAGPVAMLVGTT